MHRGDANWILLPGLGGDERLFANMIDLLPSYQIIDFEVPYPTESIEDYAVRSARSFEHKHAVVLCGISFGGMLASILAARIEPVCLVLMSSTHNPAGLAQSIRVFEWMSRLLPQTLAGWLRGVGHLPAKWLEPLEGDPARIFKDMVRDADIELFRQGARMLMQWKMAPEIPCPRFHLQGARDLLMPAAKVTPTHVAPGAGHLMNLTHPREVRSFIRDVLAEISQSEVPSIP